MKMANNDDYAEISHNLLNKDELIEKFGWEEYFVFALMLGVSFKCVSVEVWLLGWVRV